MQLQMKERTQNRTASLFLYLVYRILRHTLWILYWILFSETNKILKTFKARQKKEKEISSDDDSDDTDLELEGKDIA